MVRWAAAFFLAVVVAKDVTNPQTEVKVNVYMEKMWKTCDSFPMGGMD